ncbi:hypothetical protein, partial [Micromonospora globispora]|uniref:hypothetical protein n=1 Tax=Micromonospora globispora TaxID=1450148 RepID=UPI001A9CB713
KWVRHFARPPLPSHEEGGHQPELQLLVMNRTRTRTPFNHPRQISTQDEWLGRLELRLNPFLEIVVIGEFHE